MIFDKTPLEERIRFIRERNDQLEAFTGWVAWAEGSLLNPGVSISQPAQEYQKNITDAENIYLAHDRRDSDDYMQEPAIYLNSLEITSRTI